MPQARAENQTRSRGVGEKKEKWASKSWQEFTSHRMDAKRTGMQPGNTRDTFIHKQSTHCDLVCHHTTPLLYCTVNRETQYVSPTLTVEPRAYLHHRIIRIRPVLFRDSIKNNNTQTLDFILTTTRSDHTDPPSHRCFLQLAVSFVSINDGL